MLICDWLLRNSADGFDVTDTLRALHPRLQTILVSGFPSHDLKARAESGGIFAFFEKPCDIRVLAEAVAQASGVPRR